ncbi:cytochrome c subfamily [Pseudomonas aeruginosa]|nr:cytochrome c subfamily [Pseudomonas aeruginosa]MDV6782628.1 cytochrome c subfamily [Pseudomonas aeruginosa]RTX26184.1 cytochrome c subfamily [Pseudomonas aeruginosa]
MGCSIAVESGRRLYSAKCDSCRASRRPQRPILLASPSVPAPVDSAGARSGADALPCGFLQLRLYQHHALSLLRCP